MPGPEDMHTDQTDVSPFEARGYPRRGERLPMRVKPHVPQEAPELLERLGSSKKSYPKTTSCWLCGSALQLEELHFEWPVASFSFTFAGTPGYQCSACQETYFPREVLDALSSCVERELERLRPAPPYINPKRIHPLA